MSRVTTPQARCRVGFGTADITPPVGIYHRMWGAALHDRATGIHRPLRATALWLQPLDRDEPLVILGLDHCILDAAEVENIRAEVGRFTRVEPDRVHVALTHTHGSGWMSRSRSHLPGGELLGPYLDALARQCGVATSAAADDAEPATLVFGTARCSLAAHRDFWDEVTKQVVCGFNPAGPADDTVLMAKAVADRGPTLGTLVNYACHPTTLAWQNTLISPDYIGAMRELVERETNAPCLFLQGASGELGPREGYVGDVKVADRNGRQLGFAALSGLEALPPPGTHFEYTGPVVSGATLGTWAHQPLPDADRARQALFPSKRFTVELPYRPDLPTLEQTRADLAKWEAEEARAGGNGERVRECRAQAERMTRQITRLSSLPAGRSYPFAVTVHRLGDSLWVFTPGELYQSFQTTLRARFPELAVVVSTVTDDWQPGYVPPAGSYGQGIYQETIAATAAGSMEALTETVARECRAVLSR